MEMCGGNLGDARLNAALLAWPTAVVRQWGDIFDGLHLEPGGLQRRDGAFAPTAGTFDLDLDIFDTKLLCRFGSLLRRTLPGKRSTLAAPLKATRAGTGPAESIAFGIGDRHTGVVEGG